MILKSINEYISLDNVYYMKTSNVDKYRNQKLSKYNHELDTSISTDGIKEPLKLLYFVHDNALLLSDGHHRLDIAKSYNINYVPVTIFVYGGDAPANAKLVGMLDPNKWNSEYISPEDIGLKSYKI